MTEPGASGSAGALLRAARERQGLHIAALAATIKIPQRKLEALEADRHDQLPDATFTRALALTVCRALKIDPAPVLAQLPQPGSKPLADVAGGLNAPYRERAGRRDTASPGALRHPLSWAALAVLVAAAVVLLSPSGWWQQWSSDATSAPAAISTAASAALPAPAAMPASAPAYADAASAAAPPLPASAPAVEVVHATSSDPAAPASAAVAVGGVAVLRASEASWVEVIDAGGQVLVQRVLQPGESLGLDGRLPFKVKIGNAAATQLQFRGQGVELGPMTRDNVARLELK